MSFDFSAIDRTLITQFGITATLIQDGVSSTINGNIESPALNQDQLAGAAATGAGAFVVRFFVQWSGAAVKPKDGDQLRIQATLYNVFRVLVDVAGGAVLLLRKA